MPLEQSLSQLKETEGQGAFSLQNSKMLKVELADATVQAKLGSMVAHQGDVKFEHAGSGGMTKFMKKAMTGEGTDLMKVSGTGEVFLADFGQEIQLLQLERRFDHRERRQRPRLRGRDRMGHQARRGRLRECSAAASTTCTCRGPASSRSSPTDHR